MASGRCWLCHESVFLAKAKRSDVVLGFSKNTIAGFIHELGLADCGSSMSPEPVCDGCMCLVSDLDMFTFEADRCLCELEAKVANGNVFAEEERCTRAGAPPKIRIERVDIAEPTSKMLVPRIVVKKLTAEETAQWTAQSVDVHHDNHNDLTKTVFQSTKSGLTPETAQVCSESHEERGSCGDEDPAVDDEDPSLSMDEPSLSPGRPDEDEPWVLEEVQSSLSEAQASERQTFASQDDKEDLMNCEVVYDGESSENQELSEEEVEFLEPKKRMKKVKRSETRLIGWNLDELSVPRSSFKVEDGRFGCQSCDFWCKLPFTMENHVNEVHLKTKPFNCDQCELRFGSMHCLQRHKKVHHSDVMKRLCSCCGKLYATLRSMRRHREAKRLQEEGRLVACDQCGHMVVNLRKHLERRHSKATTTCRECKKVFPAIHSLKQHMFKEHGVNRSPSNTCQHCGSMHSCKALLNRHLMKKHGVELPEGTVFNCSQCSRVFFDRMSLEDHLNYHNGVTPFKCPLCEYKTWGRVMLNQHTRKSHNLSARNARKAASSNVSTSNG